MCVKIPGSKEFQDLTASTWVNTTCRDIQTAIIKTCAYNNRSALKLAFGEEYDKLYPGSIYSPPSYNEDVLILIVRSIQRTQLMYSTER